MSHYMLRTENYAAMESALFAVGLITDGTDMYGVATVIPIPGISVDHIGAIPPTVDIDGNPVSPGDPRWHTNIRAMIELTPEQVTSLPTFTPEPSIPYRVFA
jgi:hypothetical protein